MSEESPIRMISVDRIRVVNPRSRDKKRYQLITQSIQNLGLKVPIVVTPSSKQSAHPEYDLVCGQGRLEAFIADQQPEIPARVIDVPKDDLLLMSLIENIARRHVRRYELSKEVIRLTEEGYSTSDISRKIDCSRAFISGINQLHENGEERLMEAVMNEKISINTALTIAKASNNDDAQQAIMEAYESKEIQGRGLITVKHLLDQREFLGKGLQRKTKQKRKPDKDALVASYRREVEKQKRMNRKARHCETRLVFIKEAFRRLSKDENFQNLLRAENLETMPKPLTDLIQ